MLFTTNLLDKNALKGINWIKINRLCTLFKHWIFNIQKLKLKFNFKNREIKILNLPILSRLALRLKTVISNRCFVSLLRSTFQTHYLANSFTTLNHALCILTLYLFIVKIILDLKVLIPVAAWTHSTVFFPMVRFQHTSSSKENGGLKFLKVTQKGLRFGPINSLKWELLNLVKFVSSRL